jgi:hypothetical protein
MQPIQLKSKFDPYILNKATDPEKVELHHQLQKIFSSHRPGFDPLSAYQGFLPLGGKNHVVKHPNLPGWVIKGQRNDQFNFIPDQHIYRVRKATRIQQVIDKHGFTQVVVPKKFLYQHEGSWFVIAQELDLDPNASITKNFSIFDKKIVKPLTPEQAKEISTICFEGRLNDLGSHNLFYTRDGKIAIVDTEPVNRKTKKNLGFFRLIPSFLLTIRFTAANVESERVRRLCEDKAKRAIDTVCRSMYIKHLAKLVAKIVLPLIIAGAACYQARAMANSPLRVVSSIGLIVSTIHAVVGVIMMIASIISYHFYHSNMGRYRIAMQA